MLNAIATPDRTAGHPTVGGLALTHRGSDRAPPTIGFGLLGRALTISGVQIATVLGLSAICLVVAVRARERAGVQAAVAADGIDRATRVAGLLERFRVIYSAVSSDRETDHDRLGAIDAMHAITHSIRAETNRGPDLATGTDEVFTDALRPVLDAMDAVADSQATRAADPDARGAALDGLSARAIDVATWDRGRQAQARTDAMAAVREADAAGATVLVCAGIALTASLAGLVITRGSLTRVRTLARALTGLARGDTEAPLPASRARDELDVMARAAVAFRQHLLELMASKRQLDDVNARLETALGGLRTGVILYDASGLLLLTNRAFQEAFAAPYDVLPPGSPVSTVLHHVLRYAGLHADQIEREITVRRVALAGGQVTRSEWILLDGRVFIAEAYGLPEGGLMVTYDDVTERKRSERQISYLAHHDALTGLANRTLFRERLASAMANSARTGLAVLCMDIDHFAGVNEQLGHDTGDAVLVAVAQRLSSVLRDGDTLSRLGADEFAIVQYGADRPDHAAALAQRVIAAMQEPFTVGDQTISVGITIGIAMAPSDGRTAEQVARSADLALVRAKLGARGTWRFFEAATDATAQARRTLEMDVRAAVASEDFELYFQPLVSMCSHKISGFEALLRWPHAARGMVPPADFIPLCEELGLIVRLGEWVLRRACAEAMSWPNHIKVAVNLSPAQFRGPSVVQTVARVLAETGLPAHRLELEITESVLLADSSATLGELHGLRALGVRISMDDFGTGYSSLSYLRSFPFDKIKIDRSFIKDMHERDDSVAIVRAVAGLGSSLGITTTAEGVETQAQLDRVAAEGCDEVQGYFFSPPRPASEIPGMLRRIDLPVAA